MQKFIKIKTPRELRSLLETLVSDINEVGSVKKWLGSALAAGAIGCAGAHERPAEVPTVDTTHEEEMMPGEMTFDWESPDNVRNIDKPLPTHIDTKQQHTPGLKARRKLGDAVRQ